MRLGCLFVVAAMLELVLVGITMPCHALPDWVIRAEAKRPGRLGQEKEVDVVHESLKAIGEEEKALLRIGEYWDEVARLEKTVASFERKLGPKMEDEEAAKALLLLGDALERTGSSTRAGKAFSRAEKILESVVGENKARLFLAETFHAEGMSLLTKGRIAPGIDALRRSVKAMRSTLSMETAPKAGEVVDALVRGLVQQDSRREDGKAKGSGDELVFAQAIDEINRLAWSYFVKDCPWEGEAIMKEAMKLGQGGERGNETKLPLDELVISAYHYNIGFLHLAILGFYEVAEEELGLALEVRTRMLGETHPSTLLVVVSMGWTQSLLGKTKAAVKLLTRVGKALIAEGRPEAAEPLLRQALDIALKPLHVSTYSHTAISQNVNLIRQYGEKGRKTADEQLSRFMAQAKTSRLHGSHILVLEAKKQLSIALIAQAEESDSCLMKGKDCLLLLSTVERKKLMEEGKVLAEATR